MWKIHVNLYEYITNQGEFLLKKLSLLFAMWLIFNLFASYDVIAEEADDFKPTIVALGDSIPFGTSLRDRNQAFPNPILEGKTTVINKSATGQTSSQ